MSDGVNHGKRITIWADDLPPSGHDHPSMPATNEVRADKATIHIERMTNRCVTMEIEAGGQQVRVTFWTKHANLYFGAEDN